jgi:hypothetical protein
MEKALTYCRATRKALSFDGESEKRKRYRELAILPCLRG